MTTTTAERTAQATTVTASSYRTENSTSVHLTLGRLVAWFYSDGEFTTLVITDYSDIKADDSFRFPTLRVGAILAYAFAHPDSFVDGCRAFLDRA